MGKGRGYSYGMPSFGGMNMNQLMKQAQKMQADIQKTQADLGSMEFDTTAGGGAVYVKVNGNKQLLEVKLTKEVVDPDDVEMLQDLILTAINEAMRKVDDAQSQALGQYNIPGIM